MWTWSTVALAGTPVVFDGGDGVEVVASVAARTGLPTDQLDPVPLDRLLEGDPAALGRAMLRPCTREGTRRDAIRTELARAEAAWSSGDGVRARDHLDLAVAQLGCLTELPERDVAARVFLLRGALEATENEEAARGELRTALAFEPGLADRTSTGVVRALLEEERAAGAALQLRVAPGTTAVGPWIDGRDVAGDGTTVGRGLHLAQYTSGTGIASAWLVVGGPSTLVLPRSYRRPVVQHIASEERRHAVEALLGATLPELEAAYITWSGGLWLVTAEDGAFSTLQIAPPEIVEREEDTAEQGRRRRKKRRP